ncbi:hypothetical protein FRC11_001191 [Ceratobasidium sp. 423]|nr:hypothetical protein FRC11_001191 [Ceratobasidium sp. 423]
MLFINPHPGTAKKLSALTSRTGSTVYIGEVDGAIYDDNPAEIPVTKPPKPTKRHPEFFFDNTLIAIQIEDTLFNVHKYQLAKSEVFSKMFEVPKRENGKPREGSSPEYPIVIHGASASDFAALLRVLYASQPAPEAPLIIPAFRLANLLGFSELRTYLLPLAEKNLDDVDKIVFAREFGIKEWLAPAHIRLYKREEHLSVEEACKLGVYSVLMISRMREKKRGQTKAVVGQYYCNNCIGLQCLTHGSNSYCCYNCNSRSVALSLYNGPGTMGGTSTNTDDSVLEEEVKKWVEDGDAMKG